MAWRMIIMLLVLGVILGGIFGFEAFKGVMIKQYFASHGAPPQTVSTAKAGYQEWQAAEHAVGSVRAVNGADLALEVGGIVDELDFKSGDDVAAGALLLRLRSNDDAAKLASLKAVAELAGINYRRDQKQFKAQAVSQATLDADAANLKNADAQVDEQQAVLDKKFIRAPFAGRLGIRQVDLGQYVGPGTVVVTLQALDPVYIDFTLPQQALSQLRPGQSVTAEIDVFPGRSFPGQISAINPKVNLATRNVQVRATFRNPDRELTPGMFATVTIAMGTPQRYLTLPQTAITFNTYGDTVYLVNNAGNGPDGKPKLTAHQSFVTTGATRGDQVAVLSGIEEGDTVVTAGQMKLHNGSPLLVSNIVQPTDNPNPTPTDQ